MSGVIENFLLVGMQAAILIIATLIFRRVLKNTPKVFVYAMWMVVLLRLCVPIIMESRLGLIDRQEIKPVVENTESLDAPDFMEDNNENIVENPTITVPIVPQKQPIKPNEQLSNSEVVNNTDEMKADKPEIKLDRNQIILICWIVGAVAVLLVALVRFVQIKRKVRFAINTKENIWETDAIKTAFVMGVINNKIYLPVGLSLNEQEMILKHERTHIRHKDPIVRIVMLIVNVVYWWNPFVWIAVWFMKKDMEMFCDEAVVRNMDDYERKDYLNVLLNHSARNSGIYPVMSFGETNTKKRIEHILNMKGKSAKTLIVIMSFMLIGLVGCTTVAKHQLPQNGNTESSAENISKEEQTTENSTVVKNAESLLQDALMNKITFQYYSYDEHYPYELKLSEPMYLKDLDPYCYAFSLVDINFDGQKDVCLYSSLYEEQFLRVLFVEEGNVYIGGIKTYGYEVNKDGYAVAENYRGFFVQKSILGKGNVDVLRIEYDFGVYQCNGVDVSMEEAESYKGLFSMSLPEKYELTDENIKKYINESTLISIPIITDNLPIENESIEEPATEIQISDDELNLMQKALLGKVDIYDTEDGKYKKVSEIPYYFVGMDFRFVDLDGDGLVEVILQPPMQGSILHEIDGTIYRYPISNRVCYNEDGTVSGSSGASYNYLFRISFTKTEAVDDYIYWAIDGKVYKKYEYEGEKIEFTEEERAEIKATYSEIMIDSYEFNHNNVVTLLGGE